jgi:hypothetical protein
VLRIIETRRILLAQEETERIQMNFEEKNIRSVWIAGETKRCTPYLLVQSEFGKNFSRMLQVLAHSPNHLLTHLTTYSLTHSLTHR